MGPYIIKIYENLLLRNRMAYISETWYTALNTQALPDLFKWWPLVDVWPSLYEGQLWFLILLYGKMLKWLITQKLYWSLRYKCSRVISTCTWRYMCIRGQDHFFYLCSRSLRMKLDHRWAIQDQWSSGFQPGQIHKSPLYPFINLPGTYIPVHVFLRSNIVQVI